MSVSCRYCCLFFCFFFMHQLIAAPLFAEDLPSQSSKKAVNTLRVEKSSNKQVVAADQSEPQLDWKGWFTICLLLVTMAALILEVRPPDITMLIGAGILVVVGILPPAKFLSGFSEDIIMTIAMLCIVVRAIEIHGIINVLAKTVLSVGKSTLNRTISLMVPVAGASAFLNNTPIVLLLTPIVRRWAIKNGTAPSKFLIPLSYAAILGGLCTLIGTSTNLVIESLIRQENPESALHFFELGYIGIPCVLAGTLFMALIGHHLLPVRKDPLSLIEEDVRSFTAEFLVDEGCSLIDRPIYKTAIKQDTLIQIERDHRIIDSPSRELVIRLGDRLIFSGTIEQIAELHAIQGLRSLTDPHFKLDASSSHFSEIVISSTSLMIGKTLKKLNFREVYGATVLAIYREGERIKTNISNIPLQAGDILMLLSAEEWRGGDYYNKDYYCLRTNERVQAFDKKRAVFIVFVLFAMVVAATLGVPIMIASMAAVGAFIFSRTITIREAQNSIIWNVLLLIVGSFAFANALMLTGVVYYIAHAVLSIVGSNPYLLIGGILAVTIISTEFLSNNASALILFPIAVQIVHLAGYDNPEAVKTVGAAVAVGASCGFALPTGYQTHMIVYGDGGYKFFDFIKVGVPMDLLVWAIGVILIPYIWPLG